MAKIWKKKKIICIAQSARHSGPCATASMISGKRYKAPLFERKFLIPLLGVLVVFVVSRIIYDRVGIYFQGDTSINLGWQFIDPVLLRTDLGRNVFYLHGQPPLLNLFTGIILQIFPAGYEEVFHILYFTVGIVLAISIYLTGIFLRFPPWLSAFVSAWFMVSPATVLYEHWLFYSYPITAALTMSGFCLYQFISTNKNYWGLMFFALLSGMALTWSIFHIVWLFGIVILLFMVLRERKKMILVACLPVLVVTAWYAKNLLTVGEFTASSWAGMNLSRIARLYMPEKERIKMAKSGELSKFALLPPFRNPSLYLKFLPETPHTGIPVLDEPETSLNRLNYHHLVYVEASKYFLRDSIRLILAKPNYYIRSVSQAMYVYFQTSSNYFLVAGNRESIRTLDLWWNRLFYGQWISDETSVDLVSSMSPKRVGWWIIMSFFIVIAGGIISLWQNRRHLFEPENMLVQFMAYNILFLTVIGNLMEIGENNRFRFTIDPFLAILLVFFLRKLIALINPEKSK
jgi:hypothetical protein